jgi:hypothetical protein
MLKSACGWASGLASVNFWFPLNNLSLLWPIDAKLGVWLAHIKRHLDIATQVSVIKVNVTKIEIQFPLINLSLLLMPNSVYG